MDRMSVPTPTPSIWWEVNPEGLYRIVTRFSNGVTSYGLYFTSNINLVNSIIANDLVQAGRNWPVVLPTSIWREVNPESLRRIVTRFPNGLYGPPVQHIVSPVQQVVPLVQQIVPPVQQIVPLVQQIVPPVQHIVPVCLHRWEDMCECNNNIG